MSTSLVSTNIQQRLKDLYEHVEHDYEHYIGFPGSLDFDYSELAPFMNRMLNNVGDPHVETLHTLGSKPIEQEVLQFFADLFNAPNDEWWGYVTNGSTECNLYAMYAARERLPQPTVYYSTGAHYSIAKNTHLLKQQAVAIKTDSTGVMDYKDLQKQLVKHSGDAIVIASIGTTMTEARDDVGKIITSLKKAGVKEYYIHSDAALAGPHTALTDPGHQFDLASGADSISVSGHKFIGSPIPCGVVIARKVDNERLSGGMNYTGSTDTTISGSRNGHTPLFLWYAIQRWGKDGLKKRAEQSLEMAAYALSVFNEIGWPAWRNPNALTVMIKTPPEELATKWQLATHDGWSHVICMPGVTRDKIDRLVADLVADINKDQAIESVNLRKATNAATRSRGRRISTKAYYASTTAALQKLLTPINFNGRNTRDTIRRQTKKLLSGRK
jgi:histidine decarboxylase